MWRIFNKLFGWHYVEYRDGLSSFIAKVIELPNGKTRMVTSLKVYDANLLPDGKLEGDLGGRWTPLTWDGSLPNE